MEKVLFIDEHPFPFDQIFWLKLIFLSFTFDSNGYAALYSMIIIELKLNTVDYSLLRCAHSMSLIHMITKHMTFKALVSCSFVIKIDRNIECFGHTDKKETKSVLL